MCANVVDSEHILIRGGMLLGTIELIKAAYILRESGGGAGYGAAEGMDVAYELTPLNVKRRMTQGMNASELSVYRHALSYRLGVERFGVQLIPLVLRAARADGIQHL